MNPTQTPQLAIFYDFDGTLAPGNMQNGRFIPDLGFCSVCGVVGCH